ncbi:hypothetical protein [Niabella aquatica]
MRVSSQDILPVKWICVIICFFIIGCNTVLAIAVPLQRKYNFNSNWELHIGEVRPEEYASPSVSSGGAWKPVTLPAAWNEDEAFKKDIVDLSTGIVWYRKHIKTTAKRFVISISSNAGTGFIKNKRICDTKI